MVDEKIIEAFYMIWDSFPGSVRLIHKNHTVLVVNEIARKVNSHLTQGKTDYR